LTITLTPDIEQEVSKRAQELGTTPERLILDKLHDEFAVVNPAGEQGTWPFEPQDEWERRLLNIGKNYGVSLSNEAVSSEGLYE
jgi:hypothetical protein